MFNNRYNFVKPGLIAGLVMLIALVILTFIYPFIFPQIALEYSTQMYKSWNDPLMLIFFLHPLILGLIISWTWNLTSIIMKGDELTKAVKFSLTFFIITQIPGMFITYTSMSVSLLMISTWMLTNLIQIFVGTLIISKMNKKKVSIF